MTMGEWIKRNETAWLIVHDLIEMARDDLRLKVENAPEELVKAINMALYAARSRLPAPGEEPKCTCEDKSDGR